jgi:hypothetical protein
MKKFYIILITIFVFANIYYLNAQNIVTSAADAGTGSLREVIAAAPSGSTITFAPGVTSITLTSGDI